MWTRQSSSRSSYAVSRQSGRRFSGGDRVIAAQYLWHLALPHGAPTDPHRHRACEGGCRIGRALALGNWEWDVQTDVFLWSDESSRIFGLEPQQVVPTLQTFLDLVHPDDRDGVLKGIQRVLEDGSQYDRAFAWCARATGEATGPRTPSGVPDSGHGTRRPAGHTTQGGTHRGWRLDSRLVRHYRPGT